MRALAFFTNEFEGEISLSKILPFFFCEKRLLTMIAQREFIPALFSYT